MSVAAMTMDDQRPLMNSYDKMSTKYEQNMHMINSGGAGDAVAAAAAVNSVSTGVSSGPSGPASPTPSGFEEIAQQQQQQHHPHQHHQSKQTQETQTPQEQEQQQQQQQPQQQQQQHDAAAAEAVAIAEQRRLLEDEIENLKLEVQRMGMQCADAMRREKILMRRLANKEQEFQDYVSQIAEYKAQQAPTALALRTALLDPAVNLLFERLKKELKNTKAKLEETQNELSAWKFTPDSNTGKRLMAKCRLLYQENEELGKMTSNGRLAKLETELAMQKSFSEEVKKSQSELDDFLQELDEDVEGMQSTILFLQQELKTTRDRIQTLEKENVQLKQANNGVSQKTATDNAAITTNGNVNNVNNGNNNSNSSSNLNKLDTINESVEENGTEFHTHDANNEQSNNEAAQSAADNAAARLARKRNYEEEESAPVVVAVTGVQELPALPAMREVSTPRTLPPKKSKLRGIATRRSSQLDEEQSMVITATTTTTAAATTTPPQVLENVVIVSEEAAAAAAAATANTAEQATPVDMEANADAQSAAPARILTRRRSVRMQQNGGGGGVGGGVEY